MKHMLKLSLAKPIIAQPSAIYIRRSECFVELVSLVHGTAVIIFQNGTGSSAHDITLDPSIGFSS